MTSMNVRRVLPLAVLAVLSACNAGGGGSSNTLPSRPQTLQRSNAAVTAATTPAPTPTPIRLAQGRPLGVQNRFSPAAGDTKTGGTNGQPVAGMSCGTMYDNDYHVHAFLGVLVNGTQVAIPPTIGMYEPSAPNGYFYPTAKCVYEIHTHDPSGYIHIESPSPTSKTPLSSSIFTLGNLLDVWGQPLTANGFANFTGPVHIFYGTGQLGSGTGPAYSAYTGTTPRSIKLYSHTAIWIEVGTYVPVAKLPRVIFFTQY